jgi:hypothetical protein
MEGTLDGDEVRKISIGVSSRVSPDVMVSVNVLTIQQDAVNLLRHRTAKTKHNAGVLQRTFTRQEVAEEMLSRGKVEVNNVLVGRRRPLFKTACAAPSRRHRCCAECDALALSQFQAP